MGCSATKRMEPVRQLTGEARNFHDKYDLDRLLGAGTFGAVFSATRVDSGEVCAVKVVDLSQSQAQHTAFWSEKRSWARAGQHPNIVSLMDWHVDGGFGCFVMELCQVTVWQAWENEQELNELTYAKYFIDMLEALRHLHSVGLVHRDVKHNNFLVDTRACPIVKLCDFGAACSMTDHGELTRMCGTMPYMAPEVVTPYVISRPASDVWSMGVMVYVCFFGKWPYRPQQMSRTAMASEIRSGAKQPSFTPSRKLKKGAVSSVAIEFVKAMLVRDASARSSAAGCLKMDYLLQSVGRGAEDGSHGLPQQSLKPAFRRAVARGIFAGSDPQKHSRIVSLLKDQKTRAKTRQRLQSTCKVQHAVSSNEAYGFGRDAFRSMASGTRCQQIALKKQQAQSPDDHCFDDSAFGDMANNIQHLQSACKQQDGLPSVEDDSFDSDAVEFRANNMLCQQRAWNVQHECVYVEDVCIDGGGTRLGEAVQDTRKSHRTCAFDDGGSMTGITPDAANTYAPHPFASPQSCPI